MSDSTKVYTADQDGERLDRFLTRMEPALSRAHVQKVIAEGQALVADRVRKANYKLQAGEEVTFHLPEAKPVEILPEDIPLDILYEDSDIIVVNKARGMVVHPATGIYTGTLVNALLYHCKDLSGINGEIRPGIVHRLDKDTSGVMVAAKNDAAHLDLAEQIRTKAAHRIYRAIVCGNIREEAGVIKGDIGRHPTDRKKMAIVHEHGKPAVTHFRVLERFGDYTLVECRLETGRTHQIRVHMAHITHPLVGDPVYAGRFRIPPGASPTLVQELKSFPRQALHARFLELQHPATGLRMKWQSALPDDFVWMLSLLRQDRESFVG